jgi:hypothetical protein
MTSHERRLDSDPEAKLSFTLGDVNLPPPEGADDGETDVYPGFEPTHEELVEIARYWREKYHDIRLTWYFDTQTGEWRMLFVARDRLAWIEKFIGEEALADVVDRVDGRVRHQLGDRLWHVYCDGTDEEQRQVWEESLAPHPIPGCFVIELATLVMERFPEYTINQLRTLMEDAQKSLEHAPRSRCSHHWQREEPEGVSRCKRCRALRYQEQRTP